MFYTPPLLLHLSGASAVKRKVINSWSLLRGVSGRAPEDGCGVRRAVCVSERMRAYLHALFFVSQ